MGFNRIGDWLVGWANSSLRKPEELPRLNSTKGRGVVSEDPLDAALHPSDRLPLSPTSSTAQAEFSGRLTSARSSRGVRPNCHSFKHHKFARTVRDFTVQHSRRTASVAVGEVVGCEDRRHLHLDASMCELVPGCTGTADWMVADPLEGRSFSTSLARTSSVGSLVSRPEHSLSMLACKRPGIRRG